MPANSSTNNQSPIIAPTRYFTLSSPIENCSGLAKMSNGSSSPFVAHCIALLNAIIRAAKAVEPTAPPNAEVIVAAVATLATVVVTGPAGALMNDTVTIRVVACTRTFGLEARHSRVMLAESRYVAPRVMPLVALIGNAPMRSTAVVMLSVPGSKGHAVPVRYRSSVFDTALHGEVEVVDTSSVGQRIVNLH